MSTKPAFGWYGVDLDGTLAQYEHWVSTNHIGEPVPLMVTRVKAWLAKGMRVKIFTARACSPEAIPFIQEWCLLHIGQVLEVTNVKDYGMIQLWDDRVVQVMPNTGLPVRPRTIKKQEQDNAH